MEDDLLTLQVKQNGPALTTPLPPDVTNTNIGPWRFCGEWYWRPFADLGLCPDQLSLGDLIATGTTATVTLEVGKSANAGSPVTSIKTATPTIWKTKIHPIISTTTSTRTSWKTKRVPTTSTVMEEIVMLQTSKMPVTSTITEYEYFTTTETVPTTRTTTFTKDYAKTTTTTSTHLVTVGETSTKTLTASPTTSFTCMQLPSFFDPLTNYCNDTMFPAPVFISCEKWTAKNSWDHFQFYAILYFAVIYVLASSLCAPFIEWVLVYFKFAEYKSDNNKQSSVRTSRVPKPEADGNDNDDTKKHDSNGEETQTGTGHQDPTKPDINNEAYIKSMFGSRKEAGRSLKDKNIDLRAVDLIEWARQEFTVLYDSPGGQDQFPYFAARWLQHRENTCQDRAGLAAVTRDLLVEFFPEVADYVKTLSRATTIAESDTEDEEMSDMSEEVEHETEEPTGANFDYDHDSLFGDDDSMHIPDNTSVKANQETSKTSPTTNNVEPDAEDPAETPIRTSAKTSTNDDKTIKVETPQGQHEVIANGPILEPLTQEDKKVCAAHIIGIPVEESVDTPVSGDSAVQPAKQPANSTPNEFAEDVGESQVQKTTPPNDTASKHAHVESDDSN